MQIALDDTKAVIVATAVLHNIAVEQISLPDEGVVAKNEIPEEEYGPHMLAMQQDSST